MLYSFSLNIFFFSAVWSINHVYCFINRLYLKNDKALQFMAPSMLLLLSSYSKTVRLLWISWFLSRFNFDNLFREKRPLEWYYIQAEPFLFTSSSNFDRIIQNLYYIVIFFFTLFSVHSKIYALIVKKKNRAIHLILPTIGFWSDWISVTQWYYCYLYFSFWHLIHSHFAIF